jgi:Xaa-Pro aminopeptidase
VRARHAERLRRAADEAERQGFVALVVAPSPDLRYLIGYEPMPLERLTVLMIRPGREPFLVVPELERPLARAAPGGALLEIEGWVDGVDPYGRVARSLPSEGRVAVGDRLWSAHLLGLQRACPGIAFAPGSPVMGRLRATKDPDELDALRHAARAADETFRQIVQQPFVGRREAEVAADLARLLVEHGHRAAEFTIVASGANAASPHHEPGSRTIVPKDAVVMDFGGELAGYFSDTTRTVAVVEPPDGLEEVFGVVRDAQSAAVEAVRPGVTTDSIDAVARDVIEAAGYGERFIHRTGHGIGLEVHEAPYLVAGDGTVLEPGVTFSVEPGIYLPGRFGVRIEDIVAVTDDGVERLNRSSRDLAVVR